MNLNTAKQIVDFINDTENLHYYSEYTRLCGCSLNDYLKRHEVSGKIPMNTLVHIVLDAVSLVDGYKSTKWVYSDTVKESDVKEGEEPVCIAYKTKDEKNSKPQYLYNIEQLKRIQIPLSDNLSFRKIDKELPYVKVSGGYSGLNPNFIFTKLDSKEKLTTEFENCVKILKNLIYRGCPTKPFEPLRNHLLKLDESYDFKQEPYYYFNAKQSLKWEGVIKGGAKEGLAYNPALTFYKKLNEKFPVEGKTFLPECPFIDVVNDESFSKENSLDFYSPFYKIVVEVDGSQHKSFVQKQRDEYRDSKLANCLIKVVRFSSGSDLTYPLEKIKEYIEENQDVRIFKEPSLIDLKSSILFRFQVALIEILEKGWFDEKDLFIKLWDHSGIEKKDLEVAYQDIKTTLSHLGALAKKTFSLPDFKFNLVNDFDGKNGLKIDISVLDFYDQTIIQSKVENQITIRTDYFPYIDSKLFDSSSEKNYYYVESSEYRFKDVQYSKTKNTKQHKALLYFLQNLFGFSDFRPKQEEIVCKALNPNNGVIGLLPTGSGKSVCFQLVSLLTPGISLIVSPLKSLMNDQCCNLKDRHKITNAYQISSENRNNFFLFLMGNSKLLYISPERFFNRDFRDVVSKNKDKISQIVVDEVHCLSEWGHEFRTSYLLLFNILKNAGFSDNLLVMGTSATASVRVTKDISSEFRKLGKVEELINSDTVSRPELFFIKDIVDDDDDTRDNKVVQIVKKAYSNNEKIIVFVPFRRNTDELKNEIDNKVQLIENDHKIRSETFVGGDDLDKVERFKKGEIDVIVATKAFGMGLDVPDIRHTIHYALSASIEAIYQEMGRAGRDGKDAFCHILFNDTNYQFKDIPSVENNSLENLKDEVAREDVLSSQLFFISHEFTPEQEKKFISNLRDFINSENVKENEGSFSLKDAQNYFGKRDDRNFQNLFEKALYRLYTLGVIDLWDIDYSQGIDNPRYYGLKDKGKTFHDVIEALNKYVHQYDLSKKYTKSQFKEAGDVFFALSKWIYEHFFIYRWTSLKTLYEWLCEKNETAEDFSNNLSAHFNNYFSKNEDLDALIRDNPTDYNELYKCLTSSSAFVLNDQISNKIKEDENNFALNFLSGIVRLRLNSFDNYDGKNRLAFAFKIVEGGTYSYGEKVYNFDEKYITALMNVTCVYLNEEEKIQFFVFLYDEFRSFYELEIIQKRIFELSSQNRSLLLDLIKVKRATASLKNIKLALE